MKKQYLQLTFVMILVIALVSAIFRGTAFAAPLSAISSYSASNDDTNVYYTLNYSSTYSWYRVYIDTDQNAATGYNANGIGANYMVENNNLYSHPANNSTWSWTSLGTVTYTNTAGVANWTIARSAIGETANPNAANLVFQVEAPITTGAIYTHTYSGAGPTSTRTNTAVPFTATVTRTPTLTATAGAVTSYEAEASGNTLAGAALVESCGTCSGSNLVSWLGNNDGTLQFNGVNAASAGSYTLTIYYINGDTTARSATLSVNGGAGTSLSFPATGSWTTVGSIQTTVSLNAGSNTLKFSNPVVGSWAPDLDRITVNSSSAPTATLVGPTVTNSPVPPTATRTNTPVGPTATNTPVPPTATRTNTPVPPTATATTQSGTCSRFVATTGNDANDGLTINTPWKNIQKAADSAQAGNIVCIRGGSYPERVTVNVSGSAAGGYITFQSYPGETAILDGNTLAVVSGWSPMLKIENKSYVIVKGLEIRNYKTTNLNNEPIGIFVTGYGDHIELRNNKVHGIWNSVKDGNGHGIAVYGTNATSSINNIILDGNEVYDTKLGWSETMVVNGNVQYWEITNNLIHDSDNLGIDVIGFEGKSSNSATDQARDGVVRGNTVYNIDTRNNPSYNGDSNAACIYVDGGTRVTIEQNIGHNCNLGLELGSEHANKSTSYITVRNNFFYNNYQVGISFGGYCDPTQGTCDQGKGTGSANNNVIVNNTLYNNSTAGTWGAELYIQYNTNNNIVRNNIIYAGSTRRFMESWSTVMSGNVVNNNQYFAAGGGTNGTWIWKNVTYTTFAAYQSGSTNDANGVAGVDPLLVSVATGNLHLQSTSPAIDAGINLTEAGTVDFDGNTRIQGPAIDRGADEVR